MIVDSKFSKSQALWFTIINYIGVLIGMISTLFIYPHDKDLLGILRFVDGFAQILYPVMVFGVSTALLNFQPKLNVYLQRKLFSYSLLSIFIMILFCTIAVFMMYKWNWFKNKDYLIYGFLIAISLAYVDVFKRQATTLQKLAVPTFFEKIIPKLALPIIFLCVFYGYVSEIAGMWWYVISFMLLMLGIIGFVFKHYTPVLSNDFSDLFSQISKKHYYQYSLYAFCASLGSFFAFRIDSIMIPELLSNQANGDYSIGVNIANALMIPATGVFALYSPILSKAIKNKDQEFIKEKYISVAKNLFFIGILLYGCIVIGLKDFFLLLPTAEQLLPTLPIIYILGANVILNMATGFNTELIAFSSYYRFNLLTIVVLAFTNIILNYLVLTQTPFGIIGVAYTSLFSMLLFNLLKMWFIYSKVQILPFDLPYVKTITTSIILLIIIVMLPIDNYINWAFVIKGIVYIVSLTTIAYANQWIPELNLLITKLTKKIR